ncbi:MAG: carbohydrate ABC transporter substrate-binding protein, partial [Leifsonia sp.]
MKLSRRTKAIAAVAGAASIAIIAAGCSSAGSGSGSTDEKIELSVATFNDFGYTDELLQEYMDANPNVTVVQNKAATSNDARANYFQKLGKKGLADVEAIEVDWLPEVMKYSDLLAEVPEDTKSRWLDWKTDAATDGDGRLIGYGTDIGPEGVCYRSDLFAAAGLPTDREEVAALLEGDWDKYFEVGAQYTAATGKAWFDSAGSTYQGMINQVEAAYEDPDSGDITATENADVEDVYNAVLDASAT